LKLSILTGGGDVAPLNAVINAVISKCNLLDFEIMGFLKGWEGLLENRFLRLNDMFVNPETGGSILKTSRVNLKKVDDGPTRVLENLKKNEIDGLIVIGGEDTLSNALYIKDFPKVLISKTIDNDVGHYNKGSFLNAFTLGYPTAAGKIAAFVSMQEGMRTTAYSHERIMVVESMGMHAGWLALASSQGSPDFIIIPEFPLDYERFKKLVVHRYQENRHVIIVVSEGAKWIDGTWISADETEKDSFGHPRFRGTAEILAKKLKTELKGHFDTRNINSVNPSYLYRCGKPNTLDMSIAASMGNFAVSHLANSEETVFLHSKHNHSEFEIDKFAFNSLDDIESFHRFVDDTLYNPLTYCVTNEGKKYFDSFVPYYPFQ
jgi:6-phosphofructokinase 1